MAVLEIKRMYAHKEQLALTKRSVRVQDQSMNTCKKERGRKKSERRKGSLS